MTDNTMTLAALRKFAAGTKPLTDAQYATATATANGSHLATRATLALVAYGVGTRGVGKVDGGTALKRLAADTKPTADHSDAAWLSTLSKYRSAIGYAATAGVVDALTPEAVDALVRGYDSTADGRKILRDAAATAVGKPDALAVLLAATADAIATKSAARKGNGNVPEPDGKGKGKRDGKPSDGKPSLPLTWAQTLAVLAAAAPTETAGLSGEALAQCSALVASIADALADATATADAATAGKGKGK